MGPSYFSLIFRKLHTGSDWGDCRLSLLKAGGGGVVPPKVYWKFALGLLGLKVRLIIFTILLEIIVISYQFAFPYSLPSV